MSGRPAGEGIAPGHFPAPTVEAGHHEPAPRRVRGLVGGTWLFDTTHAWYVWEHPFYPQYAVPVSDVDMSLLEPDDLERDDRWGTISRHSVRVGDALRRGAARVRLRSDVPDLADTVTFTWAALDSWFEEDELLRVHPRNPYVRVDALRSTRRVRVELEGVLLAESNAPVGVFETGLPPRWYVDRASVAWANLEPSATTTSCPYKGEADDYWSARVDGRLVEDVAWSYRLPTRQLAPIAGLVSFDDQLVSVHTF